MKKGENNHRSKTHENEQSSEDYGCSKENSLEAIELPSADCHKNLPIHSYGSGQINP